MSPRRFFLIVAVPFGLLVVFLLPPWGGADEHVHFLRAVDIAEGHLEPAGGDCPSLVPSTYQTDSDLIADSYNEGRTPFNLELVGDLLASRPDEDNQVCTDTRSTSATSPLPYLPAALGVALPHALGAPAIVTVWFGRLFNLAAYVALVTVALSTARAFRWTMTLAASFPMVITFGATITPDAMTTAALLVVLSIWTRMLDHQLTPKRALVEIGLAGGMLALCKPPYFLVLAVLPMLLWRGRTEARSRATSMVAGLIAVGGALSLANASSNYRPPSLTLSGKQINYQPSLQRERIFEDPAHFLQIVSDTWVTEFPDYVHDWALQLATIRVNMPIAVAWIVLLAAAVAVLRLDTHDYERIANITRLSFTLGTIAFILVLYTSSYIYFDDTIDGDNIGGQMARYTIPLFPIFAIGFFPRLDTVTWNLRRSLSADRAIALLATSLFVVMGGFVATVLWWGIDWDLLV